MSKRENVFLNGAEIVAQEKKEAREKAFAKIKRKKKEQKDIFAEYKLHTLQMNIPYTYAKKYPNIFEEK